MAETVGFGVVGAGVIGPTHCEAILATPGAELVAVCDTDAIRAAHLGERFGVPHYSDLAAFLALPGLRAASVCVPSGLHASVGMQIATAGKHVLVEKPLEVSLQAADRLIETCNRAGVKLGVISQHRFAPDVLKIKQAIESGEFGPMVLGQAVIKWYRTQEYYNSGQWRGTWTLDGGGALMNQGIHYIDLLQWLMGPVVQVRAATLTRTHEIEVEDLGLAILEFADGAMGTITGSTSIYPGLPERLELHGRNATAIIEADLLKTYYRRAELGEVGDYGFSDRLAKTVEPGPAGAGGAANPAAIGNSAHSLQVADFLAAIQHDTRPAIDGAEARRPLEIILAIYQSARTGQAVTLNTTL